MNKYTYSEIEFDNFFGIVKNILRSDGTYIPLDPANPDYQRYLDWLEDPDSEQARMIASLKAMEVEHTKRSKLLAAELKAEELAQAKLLNNEGSG